MKFILYIRPFKSFTTLSIIYHQHSFFQSNLPESSFAFPSLPLPSRVFLCLPESSFAFPSLPLPSQVFVSKMNYWEEFFEEFEEWTDLLFLGTPENWREFIWRVDYQHQIFSSLDDLENNPFWAGVSERADREYLAHQRKYFAHQIEYLERKRECIKRAVEEKDKRQREAEEEAIIDLLEESCFESDVDEPILRSVRLKTKHVHSKTATTKGRRKGDKTKVEETKRS